MLAKRVVGLARFRRHSAFALGAVLSFPCVLFRGHLRSLLLELFGLREHLLLLHQLRRRDDLVSHLALLGEDLLLLLLELLLFAEALLVVFLNDLLLFELVLDFGFLVHVIS